MLVSCAVASDIDETESLSLVEQDVEDGLSVKDNNAKVRMLCLEGVHELFELRVVLGNVGAHLCCDLRTLLQEEGCTVGRGDGEEQERSSTH